MALRFDGTYYTRNLTYAGGERAVRVRIYDRDWAGSTFDLTVLSINVMWPEDDDIFRPIIGSQAKLNIMVDNQDTQDLVDDLVGADEERFTVRIDKAGFLFWVGYALPDLVRIDNAPKEMGPTYQFTCVDGIARLKKIPFVDGAGNPYTSYTSGLNMLFQCLGKIGLDSFWTAGQAFVYIHATWFPTGTTASASSNTFLKTYIQHRVFRKVDRDGNAVVRSTYEVLEQLALAFGCRFFFSYGSYWMMEVADYARSGASITIQGYNTSAGATAPLIASNWAGFKFDLRGNTADWVSGLAEAVLASGSSDTYLAPLSAVKVRYKHYTTQNLMAGVAWDETVLTDESIEDVDNNGGAVRLSITFQLNTHIVFPGTFIPTWLKYALKVNIGTKYLKRTATYANGIYTFGEVEWTSTDTDRYEFFVGPHDYNDLNLSWPFRLITPPLPESGDLDIGLAQTSSIGLSGTISGGLFVLLWNTQNFYVESYVDGNVESQYNYTQYEAVNTDTTNSEVVELDLLLGDGPLGHTYGALKYSDDNGVTVAPTTTWVKLSDATPLPLGELLAQERLGMQDGAVVKLEGTAYGNYEPHVMFLRGADNGLYIFLGGTYDVGEEIWRGSWVQVGYSKSKVTLNPEQPYVGYPGFAGDSDAPVTGGIINNPSQIGQAAGGDGNAGGGVNTSGTVPVPTVQAGINTTTMEGMPLVLTDAIALGSTPFSINVTPSDYNDVSNVIQFYKNDVIVVIHPITGEYQRWTCTKDSVNSTFLEIDGATALYAFPAGSWVRLGSFFDLKSQQDTWRISWQQVTLFNRTTTVANGLSLEFLVVGPFTRCVGYYAKYATDGSGTMTLTVLKNGSTISAAISGSIALSGLIDKVPDIPVSGGYADVALGDIITFEITSLTGTAPVGMSLLIGFT